jgi:hypothetical protein
MKPEECLSLLGSILNFIGGGLLVAETFSPVRDLFRKEGEKKWEWLVTQIPSAGKAPTPGAPPPNDESALQAAKRSQLLTRFGFALVTLGFLLDLLAKLHIA